MNDEFGQAKAYYEQNRTNTIPWSELSLTVKRRWIGHWKQADESSAEIRHPGVKRLADGVCQTSGLIPPGDVVRSDIGLNTPETWRGSDYVLDTVDELVFDNATVHFEMSSEVSAYMTIEQGKRIVFVQFDIHELTADERAEYRVRNQSRRAPKAAIVARIEHDTEDGF